MAKNVLEQKIKLNTKEYSDGIRKANQDLKSSTGDMNKSLTDHSKVVSQNESQWKKWGKSVQDELQNFSKKFASNMATGAKAMTLGFGAQVIKTAAQDAVAMAMDASEALARMQSKFGASKSQVDAWGSAVRKAAVETKTSVGGMMKAFEDLSDVVDDPAKLIAAMPAIGQAMQMNGGNGEEVSKFVKDTLTAQGRSVNAENVNDILTSADLLQRRGQGFSSMSAAMAGIGGLDQMGVKASGMSARDVAAVMAGASKSGVSAHSAAAGVNALLQANKNGLQQGSVLASILGSGKGSLMGAGGKFDLTKVSNQDVYKKLLGLGKGDETKAMEVFRTISGVGEEASDAIFMMAKNSKAASKAFEETEKDQQTLAQSAEITGNNLKASWQKLESTLVDGFTDIFKPLEGTLSDIFEGKLGKAAAGLPGALKKSAQAAIVDHPMLALGAAGTMAGAGALITGLFGKGGAAQAAGLAKGVGIGSSLKQMGVTPVYVVNAQDIGKDQSTTMGALKDMLGVGEAAGGAAKGAGKFGRAAKFLGKWGGLIGTGLTLATGAYDTYSNYSAATTEDEKNKALKEGGAGTAGAVAGGLIGGVAGSLLGPLGTAAGASLGSMAGEKIGKFIIEVDSKDPQFSARPKSIDNPRDARGF